MNLIEKEIREALNLHQNRCDEMYFEMREELAGRFNLSVDKIEEIWDDA